MDAVTVLSGLDHEKLFRLYTRKREDFLEQYRRAESERVKDPLTKAILSVDLCYRTYEAFQQSLDAGLKEMLTEATSAQQALNKGVLQALVVKSEALHALEAQDAASGHAATSAEISLATARVLLQQDQLAEDFRLMKINLAVWAMLMTHSSLCSLLAAKDSKKLVAVVEVLAEAVIELSGLLGLGMLLARLKAALNIRAEDAATASDFHNYVDNFISTTKGWCVITEASAAVVRGSQTDYDVLLQTASKTVEERFGKLLRGQP